MKIEILFKKLEGIHTIDSIMDILNVNKKKAIYFIHRLKKQGYIKTKYTSNKKRIYYVNKNNIVGESYYDVINKHSPIKLAESTFHKVYGRKITLEETLIYAIKTKKIRVITAALSLFKSINKWTLLGKLARENKVERSVGALYDIAKKIIKTRKMTKTLQNSLLPKEKSFAEMIKGFKSKDFKAIENKWRIRIPLNKADLEDYS